MCFEENCFIYVLFYVECLFGYFFGEWLQLGFWQWILYFMDVEYVIYYCMSESQVGCDYSFDYWMFVVDGWVVWICDLVILIM